MRWNVLEKKREQQKYYFQTNMEFIIIYIILMLYNSCSIILFTSTYAVNCNYRIPRIYTIQKFIKMICYIY